MKKENNPLINFSLWMIKNIHQKYISPELNKRKRFCRFYPSCSEYATLALKKDGFIRGWIKSINRINRCSIYTTEDCFDLP